MVLSLFCKKNVVMSMILLKAKSLESEQANVLKSEAPVLKLNDRSKGRETEKRSGKKRDKLERDLTLTNVARVADAQPRMARDTRPRCRTYEATL
jgi:hypothetical protein